MANRNIPLREKGLVVRRLAEGMSTREAIKGTSIRSNQTASRLAMRQSHAITQHRKQYLECIEQLNILTMPDRARIWGEMARATKTIPSSKVVTYGLKKDAFYAFLDTAPVVEEVPDWPTRHKALRYIDELAERVHGSNLTTNRVQVNLIKDSDNFSVVN